MPEHERTIRGIPAVSAQAPRVRLVVKGGLGTGTEIDCHRVVTLLGSRKGCKVRLQHPRISAVHLAVVNTGADVFAVDLVTRTGTLLNGLKMEHESVSDGDMLAIGPWTFRIDIESQVNNGNSDIHVHGLEPAPHIAALEHLSTNQVLRPTRNVCVIGRRSGCDITISDRRVSRAHALLLLNYFGNPAVVDLLSQNQVLVNDARVNFAVLTDNDIITIGETRFRARLRGSTISESSTRNRKPIEKKAVVTPEQPLLDQIDIAEVEGSQRWKVAENVERIPRKK